MKKIIKKIGLFVGFLLAIVISSIFINWQAPEVQAYTITSVNIWGHQDYYDGSQYGATQFFVNLSVDYHNVDDLSCWCKTPGAGYSEGAGWVPENSYVNETGKGKYDYGVDNHGTYVKIYAFIYTYIPDLWLQDVGCNGTLYYPEKTLSGIAIDINGTQLKSDPDPVTVSSGASASITAKEIKDYEFKGWRSSKSSGDPSGGNKYKVDSLKSDTTVYAVYEEVSYYEGYSSASISLADGSTRSIDTGWQTEDLTKKAYWPNGNGINFVHGVRRIGGKVKSKYSIFDNNENFIVNGGDITAIRPDQNKISHNANVIVGQSYCETLSFPKKSTDIKTKVETAACIDIPYNFENEAKISYVGTEDNIVYSGESTKINAKMIVKPRENNSINATYATDVDNAKYQIIVYKDEQNITHNHIVSNPCQSSNCVVAKEGSINGNGHISVTDIFKGNDSTMLPGDEIGVPDVEAGSKFCAAVAVYPANSMNDTNISSDWAALGASWYLSDPVCATVAKKPSFQIWGGNLYSNGAIKVSRNNKSNSVGKVYGSWGEFGVIAKNTVTNFASGAALSDGMSADNDSSVDCKLGPLTIANRDCKYGNSGISVSNSIRASLAEYAKNHRDEEHIQYCDTDCIVDAKQIIYQNDNNFKIIYAERNVKINCEVERIDAIIVAGGTVDTCANPDAETGEAKNAANRSNQLIINGSVIASRLVLGRTYGAATGANSGEPAEIINALPSLYYWSVTEKSDSEGDSDNIINLSTTYQRQLAPRQ